MNNISADEIGYLENIVSQYDSHKADFYGNVYDIEMDKDDRDTLEKAIKLLEDQPIRCKDCVFWEKQKDSLQGRCCLLQMYPTGEWFCGNAKRKENK